MERRDCFISDLDDDESCTIGLSKASPRKIEGMEVVVPSPGPNLGLGVDLWHLYTEQKLWDVTLNAQTKSFHVLKYILCARSPVFMAMFENDTKEKETGVVDIIDLDPDTIEQMVYFMYTDELKLLSVNNAILLYSAADKYEIMLLKNKCTSYLKSNLHLTNVLDVLSLADLHQDKELKSCAMNFLASNASFVFKSNQWKAFVPKNPPLAVDVMDFIFNEKKMICTQHQPLYKEMYGHGRW